MKKLSWFLFSLVLLLLGSTQTGWAQRGRVFDLGHYPGGTWAEPRHISDSGVVVAFGDIASGYTRPIGVPLFGAHAGEWFDLGTLGGDRTDSEVMCMGITNTGMIVGHAALPDNETVHAFAWTPKSGMVDIGTLTDLSYNFSLAYGNNKAGTLIVGYGYDKDWNQWAKRWSANNTNFVEELGSPGTWSWATKVSNSGIVTGSYGSDAVPENTVVWKLR